MFKNMVVATLAILAVASTAHAAVATFVLSLNDNGTGTRVAPTGGIAQFAVYGFTSLGDNSGFASFNFTVAGQLTIVNRAPQATFADDSGVGDNKTSGFTLLRATGGNGVATTGSFDTVSGNGLIVYGVGQSIGNVRNATPPAGYLATSTVAQGAYGVTNSFTVDNATGTQTGTGGAVPVLLATGTYTYNAFNVFTTPTIAAGLFALFNTSQNGTSSLPTTTNFVTRGDFIPEPAGLAVLGLVGSGLTAQRRRMI